MDTSFQLTLEVTEVFLDILVSITAFMSHVLFVHFNEYTKSLTFLFYKHALNMEERESLFFLISLFEASPEYIASSSTA